MTKTEKALLDTIAYSEGTLGVSNNGYDVVVTFKLINGWTNDTKIVHGDGDWYQSAANSTAAGRYQFLGSTWKGLSIHNGKNVPLTKDNQDKAAIHYISYNLKIYKTNIEISDITNKDNFIKFFDANKKTWTSFPKKGVDELFEIFKLALSKY